MEKQRKQNEEKKAVELMIHIYCEKNHHCTELCSECNALKDYAFARIDVCPFMETKSFCSNCKIHCYNKEKRMQIKNVMRFSGWRMLFHNPYMAIRHVVATLKEKRNL